eukprot:jgi/Psemu1/41818/gm1.41818_g
MVLGTVEFCLLSDDEEGSLVAAEASFVAITATTHYTTHTTRTRTHADKNNTGIGIGIDIYIDTSISISIYIDIGIAPASNSPCPSTGGHKGSQAREANILFVYIHKTIAHNMQYFTTKRAAGSDLCISSWALYGFFGGPIVDYMKDKMVINNNNNNNSSNKKQAKLLSTTSNGNHGSSNKTSKTMMIDADLGTGNGI